jgi:mono/diheme cytochrome c family protein
MTFKTLRTIAAVLAVEIVLAVAIGLIVIFSGVYDVAATTPHVALTQDVLSTTADRSVQHHASGIELSPTYGAPDLGEGSEHYREMCVTCHGAPGADRSEIGAGLYPPAPDLSRSVSDLSPQEVFWILKHGIKDTGMPAFGPTHDDEKLWDITAFVKHLPGLTPQQYRQLTEAARPEGSLDADR